MAALVEIPLFLSLALLVFGFEKGPHNPAAMVLMMTQIVGLAAMSPLDRLDSNNAFVLAAIWLGILAIQLGVVTLLVFWMLHSVTREDERS